MDVKFLRGLYSNYNAIGSKDEGTFYITGLNENSFDSIYLGSHLLGTTLASGIVLTGFNLGEGIASSAGLSATDTVLSAIEKLDKALSNATGAEHAVVSFGGKVGAITLSEEGNVRLSMVENALKAEIDLTDYVTNGTLGTRLADYVTSASLTETLTNYVTSTSLSETLEGYATKEQGALADTAVQSIATGTTNGTIKVDGTDVAVAGLGSAAFTDSSAYQPAGNYQEALTTGDYINIDEDNNITTVQGSFATAEAAKVEGLATVGAVESYVESYVETQIAANVLVWGEF